MLPRCLLASLLVALIGCSSPATHDATSSTTRGAPAPAAAAAADQATTRAATAGTATEVTAQASLTAVEELLNTALIQRSTPESWQDLYEETLVLAGPAVAAAEAAGAANSPDTAPRLEAARATFLAITANADDAFAGLRSVEGRLPQTSELLVARLFEEGRSAEAAAALASALTRWPDRAPLHQLARTWRDAIPDATGVLAALDAAPAAAAAGTAGQTGAAIPLATATRGYILLSRGILSMSQAQSDAEVDAKADAAGAAALFERGATEFLRVGSDPLADTWELTSRRADCLINAGWQHFALAQAALADGGLAAALPALQAAERNFSAALDALPDDPDAVNGINLTGDMYFQGGSLEGIREFFGRMARHHLRAEWWNNLAFFCRETEQYEESYAAYQQCIALAPDNARWVNDTGLILLYHLHRDLGHAEELFRSSIELGKAACANQFIEADRYAENFEAYTDAMLNLAKLKLEQGDVATARSVCDELLALAPNRPDARMLDAAIRVAAPSKEP